jgi:hypothetical protein
MISREVRQEASIPVQSRVSIMTLAELDKYWSSEGYEIKSMSQLIAWSLDLLQEVLKSNKLLSVHIESVADAHRYLTKRSLYQRSLKERGFQKLGSAIMFEGLRDEGIDPGKEVGEENSNLVRAYNIMHNKGSVKPFEGRVKSKMLDEAVEIFKKTRPSGLFNNAYDDEIIVKEKMTSEEIERKGKEIERKDKDREEAERKALEEVLAGMESKGD